jgi:uncharacterized protein YcbK (DUF882 family)
VAKDSSHRRRQFLKRLAVGVAAAPWVITAPRARASVPRTIAFQHTHTGEALSLTYAVGDEYLPQALGAVDRLLRDHRTHAVHPMDPALLDQMHRLSEITGTRSPFQIISGYRDPRTNEMLRSRSGGVARHSLHLEGRAVDVRLADVPLAELRDAALSLNAGGVGFYRESNFVHLDTGRVRRW